MERVLTRIAQLSRNDVKEDLPDVCFAQWRVVLVTQAVVQSQIGLDLPLVLRVADVVRLLRQCLSRRAIEERRRGRQVAEILCRLNVVLQKITNAGEGVGDAALPISVQADLA